MNDSLAASYAYCRRAARRSGSNFYASFVLLPPAKRAAMCALYAYLRHVDDLADARAAVETRRAQLAECRASLARAWNGQFDRPFLPALVDTVRRYGVPRECLEAVIDGVEMDLDKHRYDTWAELNTYCRRVASAVGAACVHIWGLCDEAGIAAAEDCGMAFQLTNILRDLAEDAADGRVYLPLEDLARFDYSPDELRRGTADERFVRLVRFEIERAEAYYRSGQRLFVSLGTDGRRVLGAMIDTYRSLLAQIERDPAVVLSRRVRVPAWRKLRIALRWRLSSTQRNGGLADCPAASP